MIQVINGLDSLPAPLQRTAVAIGVFDGVHRGHQEILHQTVREAWSQGLTPVALTFDIHPTELFRPEAAPSYIASLAQRAALMDAHGGGLDSVVMVRFDRAFAALAPQDFVADVLQSRLGARHVLVGADFRYGRGREGNVATLAQAGAQEDFALTVVPPILRDGVRISSTVVRQLVAEGDLPRALSLLGHPFVVEGVVVSGKKLGRTLGYPTANLSPTQPRQLLPGNGVYAAWAILADGRRVRAAVSVGTNPTTDTDGVQKVEAYLMDGFGDDLYGQTLGLDFRRKVRDEARFASLDALVARMGRDVVRVGEVLQDDGAE